MLQRVRGESLIISAWQRGPTDRAKAKHKDFVLHLKTAAPYLQLLCPVMCQTVWGREERSQSVLLSVCFFFSLYLTTIISIYFSSLSFSWTCSCYIVYPYLQQCLFLSKEIDQILSFSCRFKPPCHTGARCSHGNEHMKTHQYTYRFMD